jgi:hypothetical protein
LQAVGEHGMSGGQVSEAQSSLDVGGLRLRVALRKFFFSSGALSGPMQIVHRTTPVAKH